MPSAPIQSLERGLLILDILSKSNRPMSLNEVTEHFDIDRSSVFRLIATLIKHGYVNQDAASKHYSLGFKVLELAGTIEAYTNLESFLRPIVKRVCSETQQNAHLAVLDATDVVFISVEQPREGITVSIPIGTREPSISTALGRALIPFLSKHDQDQMYKQSGFAATHDFDQMMAQIKADKIAFDIEEFKPGIVCIAAPIFNHKSEVVCSIGISGQKESVMKSFDSYKGIVRQAGTEASEILGNRT